MEVPRYLQIIWAYKWMLVLAVVVAVPAAFLAGFQVKDGSVESKVPSQYTAVTRLLVSSTQQDIFTSSSLDDTALAQSADLANRAVVYSYLVTSDPVVTTAEAETGPLVSADKEAVTAVARTTPPAGDERFPGRLALPIIDVVGTSTSATRAEEISRATASAFLEFAADEQRTAETPTNERVTLKRISQEAAVESAPGNPVVPAGLAVIGVLGAFLGLIFLVHGLRTGRSKRVEAKARKAETATWADEPWSDGAVDGVAPSSQTGELPVGGEREPVGAGTAAQGVEAGRRRRVGPGGA